ncbi:MAG: hypothetical protein KJO82_13980 [Gammaproteobacteria bacterium]|nr:hypothetical protein [Gammaproteobacteria bacterium]
MERTPTVTIEDLESARIEAGSFNHEAHVYLAWLYLREYPVTAAIERFSAALKRLTLKLGVPGKYHETITWFFMLIIAQRCADRPSQDWPQFKATNSDLLDWDENILHRYYSKATLDSDEARRTFVLPDRIAA